MAQAAAEKSESEMKSLVRRAAGRHSQKLPLAYKPNLISRLERRQALNKSKRAMLARRLGMDKEQAWLQGQLHQTGIALHVLGARHERLAAASRENRKWCYGPEAQVDATRVDAPVTSLFASGLDDPGAGGGEHPEGHGLSFSIPEQVEYATEKVTDSAGHGLNESRRLVCTIHFSSFATSLMKC